MEFTTSSTVAIDTTVAIDVVAYEHDQRYVLEIGLAIESIAPARTHYEYRHLVIEEHIRYRNGDHVADKRDNFRFGRSEIVSLSEANCIVNIVCGRANSVIFHAASRDVDWLDLIGVDTASFCCYMFDTQDLARELDAPLGMEHLARYIGLPTTDLHNAGNGAALTLNVFLKLEEMLLST